jgi:hypothetical protein
VRDDTHFVALPLAHYNFTTRVQANQVKECFAEINADRM